MLDRPIASNPPPSALAHAVRGWRAYGLLGLLCLALYLPGLASLPVTDRDEARFAQATRQMLETGDLLRIRFQDEARNKKPAAIYWLQAASVAAFGDAESTAIWPYRLPSVAGVLTAVLMCFGFGARLVGREAAFLGAALLACSLGVAAEAHLAKTDAVLLATAVAAQGALGEIYRTRRARVPTPWPWALLFWTAQAVAALVKGPVVPMLSLLTVIALSVSDRRVRWLGGLRPAWGIPLFALLVAPWVIAINRATAGAFLGEAVGNDFFGKLVGAQENHGAPPGYYLLLLAVTFWPGSLFLGPAIARAWQNRSAVPERFLIAWAVPFWLMLELVPTKLPHYILPAYPALALLAGQALVTAGGFRPWRVLDKGIAALWGVIGLALAGAFMLAPLGLGRGVDAAGVVAGAIILIFGGGILRRSWRGPAPGLALRTSLLALLVLPAVIAIEIPTLDRIWLSRSAASLVERHRPPHGVAVAAVGYAEPSLVFMLGTDTRLLSAAAAADHVTAARGAVALVEAREDDAFKKALAARGWAARPEGQVAGVDYSNGRKMLLTLYTAAPG